MAVLTFSPALVTPAGACLITRQHVKDVAITIPSVSGLSSTPKSLRCERQEASYQQVVKRQVGSCRSRVQCAAGDVSAEGTNFLIIGAVAIALVGTAFPILFARKDTCPDCDGAGFVRSDTRLNANAARKDAKQIVCPRCNGLGKLGQTDKA